MSVGTLAAGQVDFDLGLLLSILHPLVLVLSTPRESWLLTNDVLSSIARVIGGICVRLVLCLSPFFTPFFAYFYN